MVKKAIILAGGLGTRISGIEPNIPKALIRVSEHPILHHIVFELKSRGIEEFTFCLGHKSAMLSNYINEHFDNLNYRIVIEDEALGTGGAIRNVFGLYDPDTFLIVNGDTFISYNINNFSDFHFNNFSEFSLVSVNNSTSERYGSLLFKGKKVSEFNEKGAQKSGWINAGHYLINSNFYQKITWENTFSVENLMEKLAHDGELYGHKVASPFIDIGVPEDLMTARNEFKWRQNWPM